MDLTCLRNFTTNSIVEHAVNQMYSRGTFSQARALPKNVGTTTTGKMEKKPTEHAMKVPGTP